VVAFEGQREPGADQVHVGNDRDDAHLGAAPEVRHGDAHVLGMVRRVSRDHEFGNALLGVARTGQQVGCLELVAERHREVQPCRWLCGQLKIESRSVEPIHAAVRVVVKLDGDLAVRDQRHRHTGRQLQRLVAREPGMDLEVRREPAAALERLPGAMLGDERRGGLGCHCVDQRVVNDLCMIGFDLESG
jgi:hypothetical protein